MTINELELKEKCKLYECSYRHFGCSAVIFTNMDTWRLEMVNVFENGKVIDKIRVEHMNLSGNRSGKMQFHSQRYAYDLDYIFDNIIIPHERGKRVYQKAFRIKKLLAENI